MTAKDRAEAIHCGKCGAEPDQPCLTPGGHRASEAHLPRRRAYHRRLRAAGTLPGGDSDSPLIRAAQAEADARNRLDHT